MSNNMWQFYEIYSLIYHQLDREDLYDNILSMDNNGNCIVLLPPHISILFVP